MSRRHSPPLWPCAARTASSADSSRHVHRLPVDTQFRGTFELAEHVQGNVGAAAQNGLLPRARHDVAVLVFRCASRASSPGRIPFTLCPALAHRARSSPVSTSFSPRVSLRCQRRHKATSVRLCPHGDHLSTLAAAKRLGGDVLRLAAFCRRVDPNEFSSWTACPRRITPRLKKDSTSSRIVGVHRIRRTPCALGTFLMFLAMLEPAMARPCALFALREVPLNVHLLDVEDGPAQRTSSDRSPTRACPRRSTRRPRSATRSVITCGA
jgi:hypothetical protein